MCVCDVSEPSKGHPGLRRQPAAAHLAANFLLADGFVLSAVAAHLAPERSQRDASVANTPSRVEVTPG